MKKEVVVSFKSVNDYGNNNKDTVEFKEDGTFFEKDGKTYLKYNETNEAGTVSVTLKLEENKATILRFGTENTQMIIEKGKSGENIYETNEGTFSLNVVAKTVDINIKEGKINLCYDVELNGSHLSKNEINITFLEKKESFL